MIKCVIFDMDGVLINTEPLHFEIWKKVFAEHGLLVDYEHYKGCIGSTYDFLLNLIYEKYGVDFRGDPSLVTRFKEIKDEVSRKGDIPGIPGVQEAVKALHEKGYRLAVASSSPQKYIDLYIKNLGIDAYFDLLFSAERVPNPKPAPDVFLTVAQRLGVDPADCMVIEDSRNGSVAAKAAGMACMGFANPDSGNQDLSAADRIFYSFEELIEVSGL